MHRQVGFLFETLGLYSILFYSILFYIELYTSTLCTHL